MKKFTILIIFSIFIGSCAAPINYNNVKLSTYDKDTKYGIEDRPNGFELTIYYSRYQFIPESSALAVACKSALTSTAWEVADKRGKKIKPVNEQRIRMSMGRNGLSGITSCQATAIIEWD